MSNDFTALVTKQCQVCGKIHSHDAEVLINMKLKPIGDKTFTGLGLCEEHDKLFKEGYIAIVAIDEEQSEFLPNGNVSVEGAHRTGASVSMRREVFDNVFDTNLPEDLPMVFMPSEVVQSLIDSQSTKH